MTNMRFYTNLAKVARLLSVNPFAARLRWVREHPSCKETGSVTH